MNITTKRFHRTLAEAFPDERASWFEPHEDWGGGGVIGWVIGAVLASLAAAFVLHMVLR